MPAAASPPDVPALARRLRAGDRATLARAITLVESKRADHQQAAHQLVQELLAETGKAVRVGITGSPGVGKSTTIDALGTYLTGEGHRVAVLAVDPSSTRTGGSILGDKTRMARLAADPGAFIRPSPTSRTRAQSSLGRSGSISSDAISVGVQPLALAGFIAIALAILWGMAGLLRRTSTRRHFLLLGGLGLIALITLVINQVHAPTVILDKVSGAAAGQGAPFSLTDFFVVNTGIAVYVALAMVAVAFLHATTVTLLSLRASTVVDASLARAPD